MHSDDGNKPLSLAERFKERAAHLEAIFEAMTDSVFVYDRQGYIVQTNKVAHDLQKRLFAPSIAAASLQDRFAHLALTDEEGNAFSFEQWPVARALAGEILPPDHAIDLAARTLDKQVLHLSVTGGPLHDTAGTLIGAVIVARDVTERRRLEQVEREARAEAENRLALLQLILDELPTSVYLVRGRKAHLVLANRAAKEVWGAEWPQGQTFATFLHEHGIRIFGTDGQLLDLSHLATIQAIEYGKTVLQHQETIRHADGTSLPVLVNAVPLRVHELYASASDTSKAVAERSEPAALVVHQDVTALKEAEQLKDEFIALAAHELRAPLAVLRGSTQMLLVQTARGKGPALAEWQTEALQGIDQATTRMIELTEDLLDVTRLQAGRLELHKDIINLVPLLQRLIARLGMTAGQHQLSLYSEREQCIVNVDQHRIEQVFTNLIGNAIKYSPHGGPVEVLLRQDEQEHSVVISIRDYGIGIPVQQQARIFGRFARADNAAAHGIGGTGLGLYLCHELVERHGGQIWFESEEGKGSTFFVRLPLKVLPESTSLIIG